MNTTPRPRSVDPRPSADLRTVQVRRYVLAPDVCTEFARWWAQVLVPARRAAGFAVDFGFVLEDSSEILWAVSVQGDSREFAKADARWQSSEGRREALASAPGAPLSQHVSLAQHVPLAAGGQ